MPTGGFGKSKNAHGFAESDREPQRDESDLVLDESSSGKNDPLGTGTEPEPEPVPLRSPEGPTFKLQESRRIRGSNAQYFDHPQFGVIARISEVPIEED